MNFDLFCLVIYRALSDQYTHTHARMQFFCTHTQANSHWSNVIPSLTSSIWTPWQLNTSCGRCTGSLSHKNTWFQQLSLNSASAVKASEKVQLLLIGSGQCAFHRATDEPCAVTAKSPKGWHKTRFCCFCQQNSTSVLQRFDVWNLPEANLYSNIFPVDKRIAGDVHIYLTCVLKVTHHFVRSFVCSLRAGVQPTLDPSTETFLIGPMHQPRERRGVDRCVWCERCVGWRRESRLEQLVRYF